MNLAFVALPVVCVGLGFLLAGGHGAVGGAVLWGGIVLGLAMKESGFWGVLR